MTSRRTGRCLCGAVSFEINGPVDGPIACHCRECQRHSGGAFWAAVSAPAEAVRLRAEQVGWIATSAHASRGFCRACGGFLFWRPIAGTTIDIALGTIDQVDDLTLKAHLFTGEARLAVPDDGAPRFRAGRDAED